MRILIYSEDKDFLEVLTMYFANNPHWVNETRDPEEARSLLRTSSYDLVILDHNLTNTRAISRTVACIRMLHRSPKVVITSAVSKVDDIKGIPILRKPFSFEDLEERLK